MTSHSDEPHGDEPHGHTTCAIDVSPDVVDAGAEMTLRVSASCAPPCDLRGHTLLVKDGSGAHAGTIELTEFDGETNRADEFVLKAPLTTGRHTWSVVCPAAVKGGTSYIEASTPISFTVTPHTTHVVAWDVPSDIVVHERFRMKVGMKCSHGCHLANRNFGIYDHEGTQAAVGTLPDEHWSGTTGLYVAEVELEAPASEGLYTWSVKYLHSDFGIPHAENSTDFGVRVVGHPEYLVTVETVDRETQAPLSGARVVMHPYRVVADESGVARVRVTKGAYKLFVSQTHYLTFGLPLEVAADMTARAELDLEPVPERN
jgi:hypothetical protein